MPLLLKGDLPDMQTSLLIIAGGDDGKYKENGKTKNSHLLSAKKEWKSIEKRFRIWQLQQIEGGKALKAPTQWPEYLKTERLKCEAKIDFYSWEVMFLNDELHKKGFKEHKDQILPHGPRGQTKGRRNSSSTYLPNGEFAAQPDKVKTVDGQHVSYKLGIPYIDDEASPYNKMPLYFYLRMAEKWVKKIEDEYGKAPIMVFSEQPPRDQMPGWIKSAKTIDDL
jgi:hypothetical protein